MKIYRLEIDLDDKYFWFNYDKTRNTDMTEKIPYKVAHNKSVTEDTPCVYIERTKHKTFKQVVDISNFQGTLKFLVNENAYKCLNDKFNEIIEFIPAICEGETKYYMLFVRNVLDAFDIDNMVIDEYFIGKKGKIPKKISKYAFKKDVVSDEIIFRQKVFEDTADITVYVTDTFKKIIETNGLIGLKFVEIWNSEEY